MVLTNTYLAALNAQSRAIISDFFSFMQFGTDNTTPTRGDTTLGNQIGSTPTNEGINTLNTIGVEGFIFSSNANGEDLVEMGMDDTLAGTDLKNRFLVNVIEKRSHRNYIVTSLNTITVTQS